MEQTPPVKVYLLPCSVSLGSAVGWCAAGLGSLRAGAELELCGTHRRRSLHRALWESASISVSGGWGGRERYILCVLCPMDLDAKPSSPQGWEPRPWKCFSGSQFPLRERSMGME